MNTYVYKMETTIRLNKETKAELDLFKQYKNESYDELIRKILFIARTCEENPKSSQNAVREINEVREKIKTSGRYTKEEIKKILNLGDK